MATSNPDTNQVEEDTSPPTSASSSTRGSLVLQTYRGHNTAKLESAGETLLSVDTQEELARVQKKAPRSPQTRGANAAATTTTTTTDNTDISFLMDPLNTPKEGDNLSAPEDNHKKSAQPQDNTMMYIAPDDIQPSQSIDTINDHPSEAEAEEEQDEITPLPSPMDSLRDFPFAPDEAATSAPPPPPPPPARKPVCASWTRFIEQGLHHGIRRAVTGVAVHAASNPWTYIISIAIFSFGIAMVGMATNFVVYFDHGTIFTPLNSPPAKYSDWYYEESGFVDSSDFVMIVHANGDNMLNRASVSKAFEALDTLLAVDGYAEVCAKSAYKHPFSDDHTCWIWSVTQFWGNNRTSFEEHDPSTMELVQAFSQPVFPDGIPLFAEALFGALERVNVTQRDTFQQVMDGMDINQTIEEVWNATRKWYGHHGLSTAEDIDYLSYVPAFFIQVGFPDMDETYDFQERALVEIRDLQQKWLLEDDNDIQLDFFCGYAYALEYQRAMMGDMPLVLVVLTVMVVFTMFVFHKHGRQAGAPLWKSRASLGLASVVTIAMSLLSGFGLLFVWGVPFTNITLLAPFVILGIGLDDTFIITGAYFRRLRAFHKEQKQKVEEERIKKQISTNSVWGNKEGNGEQSTPQPDRKQQQEDLVEIIEATMTEVGLSVSLTTITTTVAFALGCTSTIPGIRWLCMYASFTIVFDFFYQVSFFIALLVLDERRVAGTLLTREEDGEYPYWVKCIGNYVCCCCCWCCCCCGFGTPSMDDSQQPRPRGSTATQFDSAFTMQEQAALAEATAEEEFFMDRIMRAYANFLLRPVVKGLVIFVFVASFGCNVYSATKLEQQFNVVDYVPEDSFTVPFFHSMDEYSNLVVSMAVYFRDVDQSDEEIQLQMIDFVEEVAALPQVDMSPEFCWVRDLHLLFQAGDKLEEEVRSSERFESFGEEALEKLLFMLDTLNKGNFTFDEKLNLALNMPGLRDIYGEDIVRDEDGTIITSRCYVYIRNLDLADIHQQINALHDVRAVTMGQPINQLPENQGRPAFFAWDDLFSYWQLYTVAIDELINTTVMGVIAVCIVGFVMIPNWSAVLFLAPLIVMLYFNLLGTMQACGIYINAVTYVTVVISIGILVDFLMHILLRYCETTGTKREAKVKDTLETMGASMMLGGFTSFLGVVPLVFSTTKIFYTTFISFLAMVVWGVLVGLVLLPVLLSIWGPEITAVKPQTAAGDTTWINNSNKKKGGINSVTEESETGHQPEATSPTRSTSRSAPRTPPRSPGFYGMIWPRSPVPTEVSV